jgi:hypothetical protein
MRNSTETRAQRNAKGRVIARLFEFVVDASAGVCSGVSPGWPQQWHEVSARSIIDVMGGLEEI